MIVQFWLGAILLLIIASAVFVIPFLASKKRHQNSDNNRNQLNRALYDVRINELEQDDDQGLLIDKEKIVSELQHNLLDDINDEKIVSTNNKSKYLWLPGVLLLTFGSVAMYWSVGSYQKVNDWEQSLQRYPALQDKLFNDSENRPTEQELKDIMLGLRTQLASDPTDANGWLLYSRLGLVFKDNEMALEAIKKAYKLKPSSVDIRLVFAQLKMQKGDEYSQEQAEFMLKNLLVDAPGEIQAWSMYAFVALERKDFSAAIKRWQQMLTLPGITKEQAGMLRDSMSYAESKIQEQQVNKPVVGSQVKSIEKKVPGAEHAVTPIYNVNISVADHVVLPDSGFIIVYAQAVSGPKMPIAAVKLALREFPFSTQLSDANVMIKGMQLSDHNEFTIKVRLSKSGDVMNKKGDWQGVSQVITAGQKLPVDIIITEQL